MNIALTCSIKPENLSADEEQIYAEYDTPQTIADLASAIIDRGHNVYLVSADDNAEEYLRINRGMIDIVFNVAEGLSGYDREARVPRICEKLGLPHTAAGSQALIDTLDKARTKQILREHNISTPRSQTMYSGDEPICLDRYPILLKPTFEGSSKGILNENLVFDELSLRYIAKHLITNYEQPVLAEEFLSGREFTVSVIGSFDSIVLPIVEITFDHLPEGIHPMDSYESKWVYDSPLAKHDPVICPARILPDLEERLCRTALCSFQALNCQDWARIDIRLDGFGVPNVLEINALPGFMKDPAQNSRLPKAAYAAGWSYESLIERVIISACQRYVMF